MPQRAHSGAMNKTPQPSADSLDRQWFVVDAADQTLGRLASEVAQVLRGKNKPIWIQGILLSSSTLTRSV
jgi:ribosomal protein L13